MDLRALISDRKKERLSLSVCLSTDSLQIVPNTWVTHIGIWDSISREAGAYFLLARPALYPWGCTKNNLELREGENESAAETRYIRFRGVRIAYQVTGNGQLEFIEPSLGYAPCRGNLPALSSLSALKLRKTVGMYDSDYRISGGHRNVTHNKHQTNFARDFTRPDRRGPWRRARRRG